MGEIVDAHAVSVRELLSGRLSVPRYQRDYEWTPKAQIGALLDDLFEHFGIGSQPWGTGQDDDYLLGPIVVTSGPVGDVIDGQQRCLTLFMLAAALRYRLAELDASEPRVGRLQADLTDLDESDRLVAKLRHHDPLAEEALRTIISLGPDDDAPTGTNESLSNRRIVHGFRHLHEVLSARLPANKDRVKDFLQFVLTRVKLIKTSTGSETHALIIFERANDRGKPLDPSDLLKNLIFQQAEKAEFVELDKVWKQIQNTVEDIPNVRMIDFLRWHHLSLPGGFYSTKRTLYAQIKKHGRQTGIHEPATYVAELKSSANRLRLMAVDSVNPATGLPSRSLSGIRAMGGIRQKQHWPVLLAASAWEEREFDLVARGVERLLLASYVTDERSQTLERTIRGLTEAVRELPADTERAAHAARMLDDATASTREEGLYEQQWERLSYDDSRQAVRYVLTKIHDGLYGLSQGRELVDADGGSELYGSDEIEHVWPKSDADGLVAGTEEEATAVHSIGNLVMLNKSENSSGGRRAAIEKLREFYPQVDSRFVIARNLHKALTNEAQGPETYYNRMVQLTPSGFETWGRNEVAQLAAAYRRLLDEVMPPVSHALR